MTCGHAQHKLDSIYSPAVQSRGQGLACLWDYVKQHGTSQVPYGHKTTDGFLLGVWVSRSRKTRGENTALDQLLESLPGWTWTPHERGFEERLAHYRHVAEAGNVNRHRALRMWGSKQVDPGSVMDQLGHADPAFTLRIYRHGMRRDPLVERDRSR
jgi:hypothetical protein